MNWSSLWWNACPFGRSRISGYCRRFVLGRCRIPIFDWNRGWISQTHTFPTATFSKAAHGGGHAFGAFVTWSVPLPCWAVAAHYYRWSDPQAILSMTYTAETEYQPCKKRIEAHDDCKNEYTDMNRVACRYGVGKGRESTDKIRIRILRRFPPPFKWRYVWI